MAVTVSQVLGRMATAIEALVLAAPYNGGATTYLRHPVPVLAWDDSTALVDGDRRYGLVRVRTIPESMVGSRSLGGAYARTEVDVHWVRVLPSGPSDVPAEYEDDFLDDENSLIWAVVSNASKTGGATWTVIEATHEIGMAPGSTVWSMLGKIRFLCQHQIAS